jgi:tetratricopeptide (TPR) repeat protein
MEAVVLVMACASPWAFGAGEPVFEFLLTGGLAGLSALWALRTLLEGRLHWAGGLAGWCLAGLFLLGALQLAPLPRPALEWMSPGTIRLRDPLLPVEREALPGTAAPGPAPEQTISLYPGATRRDLFRLLNVFLLFGVVRNNLSSRAALRRLALVVFANGVLLAFFGILQHITAGPHGDLYWTYPSPNSRFFGPFVSRNTYSYCANLSIGFGLSLLVATRGERAFLDLLRCPTRLWVSAGLAVIFTSIVLCQSRGGVVSFGVAAGVCLAVWVARVARVSAVGLLGAFALTAFLALVLITWLGFEWKASHLSTLADVEALQDSGANRASNWEDTLPVVEDCPLFGTGYGTFASLAAGRRPPAEPDRIYTSPAHNDYVETLVDGGAACLLVLVVLLTHLARCGWKAAGSRDPTVRGLALGGLFGLVTVAVHSVFNFMVRVPAIAVLTVIVCAQLEALAARPAGRPPAAAEEARKRRHYLAPAAAAVLLVGMGVAALAQGWRVYRAQQYLLAAYGLTECPARPVTDDYRVACLEAAERLLPDNAHLQLELGQAHFRLYRRQVADPAAWWPWPATVCGVSAGPLGFADVAGTSVLVAGLSGRLRPPGGGPARRPQGGEAARAHLAEALRHYVRARDLCPLLTKAHLRIAANVEVLARAEPRTAYLARATSLLAGDADLWYVSGLQELLDGRRQMAWDDWRHSLACSDRHLAAILYRAGWHVGPRALLDKVLPDRPDVVLAAAERLYPDEKEGGADRRPFLQKALRLLGDRPGPLAPRELRVKAKAHRALGQPKEAEAAYRAALARVRRQPTWRYELAALLCEQGQLAQAQQEVLAVLAERPDDARARELFREVVRRMARKERRAGRTP